MSRSLLPKSSFSSVALMPFRTFSMMVSCASRRRSIMTGTGSAPSGGRGMVVSSAA